MSISKKSLFMLIFLLVIPFINAQTCFDSDGGLNYFVKGCVTLDNAIYCDSCMSTAFLSEVYCTENKLNVTIYDCSPMICEDGMCISATTTATMITTTTVTTQTTTSVPSSTTIPSLGGCDSCLGACRIECDQTIRRSTLQGDSDYFKFTLSTEKKVRIQLNSIIKNNNFGDYDLFANWDSTCPEVGRYYPNECSTEGGYDCGPCSGETKEECTGTLKPGTYYFMVYNYKGENFSYEVSLVCSDVTTTSTIIAPTTTVPICSVNTDCCETFKDRWVTCSDGKCIRCAPNVEGCSHCPLETTTTTLITGRQRVLLNLIAALKNPVFILLVVMAILVMLVVYKFMTKRVEPSLPYEEEEEEILVRIF
ncbi:MAG: PPC domain-containing protein [Candidatus Aenigmarchaeota archaeon]|nr:PPC domain-containing protein [Candidatus Aenigmarchaeota archaeon]